MKTLIITIGNSFRKDDGIGPYIGEKCGAGPGEAYVLINCYDKPENCIDEALELRPGKTVLIDAALFGGAPGEARLLPYEQIPDTTLSTHTFPPKIIAKLLMDDTGCPVHFLGIQPADLDYGTGLSEAVQKTGDLIISYLAE